MSAEMRLFEQRGDGVVEGLVAGEQRDDDGGVDAEYRFEDARHVEQQQDADERGEGVVTDSFLAFFVHKNS